MPAYLGCPGKEAIKRVFCIFYQIVPRGMQTKPRGMQCSIFLCLSQARINWENCDRKGIWRKNGGMMEVARCLVQRGGAQLDCRCIYLCYLPLHHKIQKIMVGKSMIIGYHLRVPPHAYANRRWGNPARMQHNPVLRQRVVFLMT